jgi:hypothetical protein
MPKGVVNIEILFDLQDNFKWSSNVKTNSSISGHEVINLGMKENLKNVNLGIECSKK